MHCSHVVLKVFSVLLRIPVIWVKAFWRNWIELGVDRLVKGEMTVGELVISDGGSTTGSWRFWVGIVSGSVRSSGKTVLDFKSSSFWAGLKLVFIKNAHDWICDQWLRFYGCLTRSESREKCLEEISCKKWTRCKIGWDAQRSRWSREKGCSSRGTWLCCHLICLYVMTRREKV